MLLCSELETDLVIPLDAEPKVDDETFFVKPFVTGRAAVGLEREGLDAAGFDIDGLDTLFTGEDDLEILLEGEEDGLLATLEDGLDDLDAILLGALLRAPLIPLLPEPLLIAISHLTIC